MLQIIFFFLNRENFNYSHQIKKNLLGNDQNLVKK